MKRNYRSQEASHKPLGFRGSQEFHARQAGRLILTIGGFFTYGVDVGDYATYGARLGALLDAKVINAGVNGYGSLALGPLAVASSNAMLGHGGSFFLLATRPLAGRAKEPTPLTSSAQHLLGHPQAIR